jgi:hypothetical protein
MMKKTFLLMALFGFIALFVSCSGGEEVTVSKYFEAIKLKDKDTMQSMALEPKEIIFKKYEITAISEPDIIPLQLANLEKKLADLNIARKKQVDLAMDKQYEVEDLQDELDETRRRSKKAELEKQIEEKKLEMEGEKQKLFSIMQQINATKKALNVEKALIKTSTGVDRNFELYAGESHQAKVDIKVTLPDGSTQDYVFILKSYQLTLQDRPRNGRMVIIKIATAQEFEQEKQQKEEAAKTETEEVSEEKPAEEGEKQ